MWKHITIGSVLILLLALSIIARQAPQRGAAPPREPKVVRIDPAFDAIAPASAQIEKVAGGFGFAEGPVWTRQGSLIFSDIPGNAIMRLTPAGQATDERYLYVANSDPMKRLWMRFEVKPNGTLGAGAVFYAIPPDGTAGIPDGLKLDATGNLYGTGPGGVWVISPEGKLLGRFEPPEVPANVAWGDDGKTLYMTARTSVYRIRLSAAGKQPCCS